MRENRVENPYLAEIEQNWAERSKLEQVFGFLCSSQTLSFYGQKQEELERAKIASRQMTIVFTPNPREMQRFFRNSPNLNQAHYFNPEDDESYFYLPGVYRIRQQLLYDEHSLYEFSHTRKRPVSHAYKALAVEANTDGALRVSGFTHNGSYRSWQGSSRVHPQEYQRYPGVVPDLLVRLFQGQQDPPFPVIQ